MNALIATLAAGLALVAAVLAVSRPNAVHGLLLLIATLLALSVASFALGASFAAILLVLIYVGTIVVVFVFVVITLDTSPAKRAEERAALARAWKRPAAVALLVVVLFVLGFAAPLPGMPEPVSPQAVGLLLFGPWALAIELAGFLLLCALIGVRHLARQPGNGS